MKNIIYTLIFSLAISLVSCQKDKDKEKETPQSNANAQVSFRYFFDEEDFELNTDFVTENNDTINISKFAFFVSNIKLTRNNGDVYSEQNSYHCLQKTNNSPTSEFGLQRIPNGVYTKIEFSIGVDPLANTSLDHQTADLLPSNNPGMIWNWNTGYKFLVAEGTYRSKNYDPTINTPEDSTNGAITYHIGLDANYKTLTFDLNDLRIEEGKTSLLHFGLQIEEIFKNPNTLNMETQNRSMSMGATAALASDIADNYTTDMIQLVHEE